MIFSIDSSAGSLNTEDNIPVDNSDRLAKRLIDIFEPRVRLGDRRVTNFLILGEGEAQSTNIRYSVTK